MMHIVIIVTETEPAPIVRTFATKERALAYASGVTWSKAFVYDEHGNPVEA